MNTTARLLIACPDRPGIVAAVTGFLFQHGANITDLDQHSTDPSGGTFFMRLEFQTPGLDVSAPALERGFSANVAARFSMVWSLNLASRRRKMALFVSRHDHALLELLWRCSRDELPAEITAVISNHRDLEPAAQGFGVPFHYIPVEARNKAAAERKALDVLAQQTELIVLARYMQVLSAEFVAHYPNRIINIHHSFLPAFAGADPYQQAYDKGVKLIGATAHYVTAELDEGPIIEQAIARVTHRDSVDDLKRLGRDLERQVLARAVQWHLED
ncbi:MAG: formyltetrahydrofolate deformylase, partial [Nevskiales bacterium]